MRRFLKQVAISTAALMVGAVGLREAQAWLGSWVVEAPRGAGWAEAHGLGSNFDTAITVKCSSDLAGIGITVRSYRGDGLRRHDDAREAVEFVVLGSGGTVERFYTSLRFDGEDDEWRTDGYDMPLPFLNAFARGSTMWLNGYRDEQVDTFTLKGSAAAARTMRATCWERSGG